MRLDQYQLATEIADADTVIGIDVSDTSAAAAGTVKRFPVGLLKGAQGAVGPQGAQGEQGIPGSKGETGAQGPVGATGSQGAKGETGTQGAKGETGAQGLTGPKGEIGLTGPQGSQGQKGETGATGATGTQGIQGATGLTGATGAAGATGATGAKGDPGLIYQNGTSGQSIPKVWTGKAVTDANGDATFSIPSGYFAAVHAATPAVERATTNATQAPTCYLRTVTATSVVVRVAESKTTTVLILNTAVEGLEFAAAGITVHLVVWGA